MRVSLCLCVLHTFVFTLSLLSVVGVDVSVFALVCVHMDGRGGPVVSEGRGGFVTLPQLTRSSFPQKESHTTQAEGTTLLCI